MRRTRWVGAVVVAAVATTAIVAIADGEPDRNQYESQIGDKLDEAASNLGRVSSASSASDIDSAKENMDEVRGLLEKLDEVKGDDETANNMVEQYLEYIDKFNEAAAALHALKDHEYELDDRSQKCRDAEQQLEVVLHDYVANADEKATEKRAPKLKKAVQDNLATLAKIKDSELRGSNDPRILTKLKYGQDKHKDLQENCDYAELAISDSYCDNEIRPGSSCRLDCVLTGSTCSIHEIKPKTSRGEDEAAQQLRSYKAGLLKWYAHDRKDLLDEYPKLSECEHGDGDDRHLDVDTAPEFYDFCPSSNDEVGASFQEVNDDVDSELQR